MKEYKSVMTKGNHKVSFPTEITGVTPVIEDHEKDGWRLHTCQVVFIPSAGSTIHPQGFYHHFLFEKEKTI
ncbi:hypothetical protein ACFLUJ_06915 [Chloroflexota bacterium]